MLASVALSPELLRQGKRARGDHLHQGSVQLKPRHHLASQSRTITVQDFVAKEERGSAEEDYTHLPDNYARAKVARTRTQMRTLGANNRQLLRSMPSNADYLAMANRYEPPPEEDESTDEQQGGLQTLKYGLWEHYGRQHVAQIARLQRAFRRCLAKKDFEQRKFDAFYDTKFRQLYSVDAQDAFQARLVKRL